MSGFVLAGNSLEDEKQDQLNIHKQWWVCLPFVASIFWYLIYLKAHAGAQWSFLPKLAQKLNKLICPEHVVAYINWLVGWSMAGRRYFFKKYSPGIVLS